MRNWFLQTWAIRALVVSRLSSARLAVRFLYGNTPFISFPQCVGTGINQVLLWLKEKAMKVFKTPAVGDAKPAKPYSSPVMQDDSILCTSFLPLLRSQLQRKVLGQNLLYQWCKFSPPGFMMGEKDAELWVLDQMCPLQPCHCDEAQVFLEKRSEMLCIYISASVAWVFCRIASSDTLHASLMHCKIRCTV